MKQSEPAIDLIDWGGGYICWALLVHICRQIFHRKLTSEILQKIGFHGSFKLRLIDTMHILIQLTHEDYSQLFLSVHAICMVVLWKSLNGHVIFDQSMTVRLLQYGSVFLCHMFIHVPKGSYLLRGALEYSWGLMRSPWFWGDLVSLRCVSRGIWSIDCLVGFRLSMVITVVSSSQPFMRRD